MSNGTFHRPADGPVTSWAGPRPGVGAFANHYGVDIGGQFGWNVRAAYNGTVVRIYGDGRNDRRLIIRHSGFLTSYLHLSAITVRVGQRVRAGDIIGKIGTAGTGPHLHFEVHPGAVWQGIYTANMSRANNLIRGTRNDGSSNPPRPAATPASSGSSSSSSGGVTGRFLRVTDNDYANIRASATGSGAIAGTQRSGHLIKRSRRNSDTSTFYAVGDRWWVHKSVATPVRAPASSELIPGSWPGAQFPVNGTDSHELTAAWRELLARVGIPKGPWAQMIRAWLTRSGYGPGNPSDLQRLLRDRGYRPGAIDGDRGPNTRTAEKRFLNDQIEEIRKAGGSMWPQHYRHTP